MNAPITRLGARILIVEDEASHAEAMRRALEAASWTNVEIIGTLREYRTRSNEAPPDVALIDLNLPDGRATDLLTQPAEQGRFPLIIMTSHGDEQIVREVMKAGAFDYLLKSQQVFLDLPRILTRILREWNLLRERTELMNEATAIYELSLNMICTAGLDGYFRRVNPAFQRILGYTPAELYSKPYLELVHPDDKEATIAELEKLVAGQRTFNFNHRFQSKTGEYHWLEWNAELAPQGGFFYAVAQDVTERKQAEEKIHHLAFYDALTLLPNRRLLTDRLRHSKAAGARSEQQAALLFIDLDNFKALNDTQGHNIGDLLLIETARRIQSCVRDVDTVARLGGDEFVVMLEALSPDTEHASAEAMRVGEKIRELTAQPYYLEDLEYHCSASIGISLFRGEEEHLDALLKHADAAMYQAKDAGRNTLRFYDPQMQADLEIRTRLEADLRHALAGQQFKLYYQLQANSQGEVIGAEALLRWLHPEHGLVSPLQFIPIAESSGLIIPIGAWVLRTACAQLKAWQANPHTARLQLAVNVSARQFRQSDFVAQVLETIQVNQISAHQLKLELTESLVLDNLSLSIGKMQALRAAGVRISMDDFGTGHSSLSYLRRLPLDQLKIDQSFVRDIPGNNDDAAIVKTIIVMAHNLGMEVIAEGVETQQQRDFLTKNGCHLYQGYFFGKPVPIADFRTTL